MERKTFLKFLGIFGGGVLFARINKPLSVEASVKDNVKTDFKDMLLLAHPIGSYYISDEPINPSELFGGTWEQLEDGTTIQACSCGAGVISGSNTVTLSANQIPTLSGISGSTGKTTTVAVNSVGSTNTTGSHTHPYGYKFYGDQAIGAGEYLTLKRTFATGDAGYRFDTNAVTTDSAGNHAHNLNIPALSVKGASFSNGKFTNSNQASVDVSGKRITAYIFRRIA